MLFHALASNPLWSDGVEENRPSVQEHEDLEEESDARHDPKASASRRWGWRRWWGGLGVWGATRSWTTSLSLSSCSLRTCSAVGRPQCGEVDHRNASIYTICRWARPGWHHQPPKLSSYTVQSLLSLSLQLSLPTLFALWTSNTNCFFFFSVFYSLSLSLPSVFFISYTSRPPLLLHSSLFLMCCFPVEFGCLTLYNSVMQMFASSTVVLWREIQCQ